MYIALLVLCVLLKLTLVFVYSWWLWCLLLFIGIGCCVALCVRMFRNSFAVRDVLLILLLLGLLLFPTDTVKFTVMQSAYQDKAVQLVETLAAEEDGYMETYTLPSLNDRVLFNNLESGVTYIKQDEHIVLSFTKSRTFFNWYAYVYFSDPEAVESAMYPSKLQENFSDEAAYDSITWLKGNEWALVKWY